MLDFATLIFLGLAVFIFVKLRSVLGQRTGSERPPVDLTPPRPQPNENVVRLPSRAPATAETEEAEPAGPRWADIAEPGSTLERGLDDIVAVDAGFDPRQFVAGARAAYEMIVTAFAAGDRRTLRNLLAKDVYDGFVAAIADRESRGETVQTRFVSIDKTDIAGAEVKGKVAQVTVRFVSQLITVTHDNNGVVVDGSADQVTDVTDIWTFSRDLTIRDPNWKLIATEAA